MADNKKKDTDNADNIGQEILDEQQKVLEARLNRLYGDAITDMNGKLNKHLRDYNVKNQQKLDLLSQGKITKAEYDRWKSGQVFIGDKMRLQIDGLTKDLVHTDEIASAMINGELPSFYATGYNFTGFQAEMLAQDLQLPYSAFTVYNKDAVAYLAKEYPQLLPTVKTNVAKDFVWNQKHIATAITQGILQGESVPKIAERLMRVANMDLNTALRNARTATNSAENKGRYDSANRIKAQGLPIIKTWNAARDARTRDTHLLLNGTHPDENGYFGTKFLTTPLRYPQDPLGAPEEVYNCRCRLDVGLFDNSNNYEEYRAWLHDNFYGDWLAVKNSEAKSGKDIERMEAKEREDFLKAMYGFLPFSVRPTPLGG